MFEARFQSFDESADPTQGPARLAALRAELKRRGLDGFVVPRADELIIAVLANGLILTGVSDVWQYIIKGLVIIGAVALDRYRMQGSART